MNIVLALALIILVFGSAALLMIRHGYLPSPLSIQNKKSSELEIIAPDAARITKETERLSIQSGVKANAKTYAFVVGADSYAHPSLQRLPFIKNDVENIANVLKKNYSLENLVLLTGKDARRESVLREFKITLEKATSDDIFLFYFSGHGFYQEETGQALTYYGTYDTDPKRLEDTAISAKNLQEFLSSETAGRMLFILDACHSGSFSEQFRSTGFSEIPQFITLQSNRAIITSRTLQGVKPNSYRNYQRFFTKYLLEGLAEVASPKTNLVRIRDLYYFISEKLDEQDLDYEPILQTTSGENFPLLVKKTEDQE